MTYALVAVAWVSGVVLGRVPRGVYGPVAGSLQWSTRLIAYYTLVVPTYPSQPFGPASVTPPAITA